MAYISGNNARPPIGAVAASAIAGTCFAAATLSVLDAADGWQQVLDTARAMRARPGPTCPGQWTVVGWGDGAVLVFGGVGIALVAVTLVGSSAGRRWRGWGQVTALLALVPAVLL